ncbi:PaaX family transcriptional regulator [Bacillus sp. BRMEA1]|uniref:PaaX family transcriptional regulator C-terminal domain-containing protein n=1 Tax=Neobacillus endophyticus TaxID=2738405 RepID=UPI001564BCFC|nr:PaaX family transcriptional regulator C-terminal domain-containing protein [Neobacillus endophyticus]NRD77093.1 PaaX family transcriptional regulator [Neobacillus endophyticus]
MLSIEKQILFLLSRAKEVTSQEFVQIYEMRGYSKQYIRNVLFNLKKNKLVISPERSIYHITEEGSSLIKTINKKPLYYNKDWDGAWDVVMFEFPVDERKKRDLLRTHLLELGFGLLYNSVYISPWDHKKQIVDFLELNEMRSNSTYFHGKIVSAPLNPADTFKIWPLENIKNEYGKYWDWFQNEFKVQIEPISQVSDDELFINHILLGEKLSEIMLMDPMLPQQLLPSDWKGHQIFQEIYDYFLFLGRSIPRDSKYYRFVTT